MQLYLTISYCYCSHVGLSTSKADRDQLHLLPDNKEKSGRNEFEAETNCIRLWTQLNRYDKSVLLASPATARWIARYHLIVGVYIPCCGMQSWLGKRLSPVLPVNEKDAHQRLTCQNFRYVLWWPYWPPMANLTGKPKTGLIHWYVETFAFNHANKLKE